MVLALERCRKKKRWHGSETVYRDNDECTEIISCLGWQGPRGFLTEEPPGRSMVCVPCLLTLFEPPFYVLCLCTGIQPLLLGPKSFCIWSSLCQECSSLILFISGPILAYHYIPGQISLSPTDPDHPNWGIPPCPVQRLSITSQSFHFFLPLIMISHHLHYLSVDLAMVCFSPLPVRVGILSVLTPLHPYVLTRSLAHGGCSIHLC